MGDSFSSGEGNPPFEHLTDQGGSNENRCHRSSKAYPRLLEKDSSLNLGSTAFVACSGATTNNVLNTGSWNEDPQLDALSIDTEVVTLTIGGNDIGFKQYVINCGTLVCGPGTSAYTTIIGDITDPAFEADLEVTYESILDNAPNADLYVVNYPYMTAEDASMCGVFDFSGARNVQQALNYVIWSAAYNVGQASSRIHHVNVNANGSPFEGKHLCNEGVTHFNGFDASHWEYSFHPNSGGQDDYANIMANTISP